MNLVNRLAVEDGLPDMDEFEKPFTERQQS